jgi:hypothetical protein
MIVDVRKPILFSFMTFLGSCLSYRVEFNTTLLTSLVQGFLNNLWNFELLYTFFLL